MKLFETILTEYRVVKFRVRANTAEEASEIFDEFQEQDPGYIAEEVDLNGVALWENTKFREVTPKLNDDEYATITKNEDGTFDAQYERGTT